MKRPPPPSSLASRRGSAIIMVVIILGVLALLGAAALKLAQQDAVSVNQRITRQSLAACAEAAQRKLLADVALRHGPNGTATAVVVPGANTRLVVGHYDSDDAVADVSVSDNFYSLGAPATSGGFDENDTTNTIREQPLFGKAYRTYAHCTDAVGRQYEVEVVVKWM